MEISKKPRSLLSVCGYKIGDAMQQKFELVEPMVTNIVRRALHWLLSREVSQSQLPL